MGAAPATGCQANDDSCLVAGRLPYWYLSGRILVGGDNSASLRRDEHIRVEGFCVFKKI